MRFRTVCILSRCINGAAVLSVCTMFLLTPSLRVRSKKLRSLCCGTLMVILAIGQ